MSVPHQGCAAPKPLLRSAVHSLHDRAWLRQSPLRYGLPTVVKAHFERVSHLPPL